MDICEGLEAVHYFNILHLDLKPKNILLYEKTNEIGQKIYNAKITDFGISKQINQNTLVTDPQGITKLVKLIIFIY